MRVQYNLERFITAQERSYPDAFTEIKNGDKQTHWMWFVFPQLAALGKSETAKFYGIVDKAEAELYLQHPTLGSRLIEISTALMQVENKSAYEIFGSPDDMKLKSSMTLFSLLTNSNSVFEEVLKKYFNGEKDERTLELVKPLFKD